MSRTDVYESVTDRIVAALEEGVVPWKVPWVGGGPVNVRSGRPYRGINIFLLGLRGYGDPRWGTFKAVKEAAVKAAIAEGREVVPHPTAPTTFYEVINGEKVLFRGGVRKGEKGTAVILWKPIKREKEENGQAVDASYRLLKSYTVFNAEQCEGLPELETEFENSPIERAQLIVDGYEAGPGILLGGGEASYSPLKDLVRCPELGQFRSAEGHYSTLFHELVHSTGHEKRLARIEPALFGTDPYAREELVAEMGAAMLCGMAGIDNQDQSAAYVSGWLKPLQNDRKLVVQAAAQAQKAADLILGTTFGELAEPQGQLELVA